MMKKRYEKPSVEMERYVPNLNVSACTQTATSITCLIGGQMVYVFTSDVAGCTYSNDGNAETTSNYYFINVGGTYYLIWYASSTEKPDEDALEKLENLMEEYGLSNGGSSQGWHYGTYSGTPTYGTSG